MSRYKKLKISNRKIIFHNSSRDISCIACGADLIEKYVLSSPNERYRCLECALRLHMIDEIPEFTKEVF